MSVHENVKETPIISVALFVLLGISFIINTLGFASSWLVNAEGYFSGVTVGYSWGLWRACVLHSGLERCILTTTVAGGFMIVVAMVSIGVIATLVSFFHVALFVINGKSRSWIFALCLAISCFATVVFNLIGVALFRMKMKEGLELSFPGIEILTITMDNISWGYYITCVGAAMYIVSGIGAIILMYRMRRYRP